MTTGADLIILILSLYFKFSREKITLFFQGVNQYYIFWVGDWRRSPHPRTCFLVLLRRDKNLNSIENLLMCFVESKSKKMKKLRNRGGHYEDGTTQLVTMKRGTCIEPKHCSIRINKNNCMQKTSTTYSFVNSECADHS